jgi:hypothetical protein
VTTLPNPFLISALEPAMAAETAAARDLTDPPVAAPDRFILDEPAFIEALARPDYLEIVQVLAAH